MSWIDSKRHTGFADCLLVGSGFEKLVHLVGFIIRMFITAFTRARHLPISISSPRPQRRFTINFNIIHPSMSRSSKGFLSRRFPPPKPCSTFPLPHTCHVWVTRNILLQSREAKQKVNVSPVTTKYTLYIYYISMPYFCYTFRCVSHHLRTKRTPKRVEVWYRHAANIKCAFSLCNWRDV